MITVILHGALRQRFGKEYRFAVKSAAEAVRALRSQLKGFTQHLREHSEPGYRVLVDGAETPLEGLHGPLPSDATVRIVPVVSGRGDNKGWISVIVGAILIVATDGVYGYDWIGASASWEGAAAFAEGLSYVGYAMVISGVSNILFAPQTQSVGATADRPENKASYAFDGAVNTAAQGNAVPVCYGELIVGSQVVSAGLSVEQIA